MGTGSHGVGLAVGFRGAGAGESRGEAGFRWLRVDRCGYARRRAVGWVVYVATDGDVHRHVGLRYALSRSSTGLVVYLELERLGASGSWDRLSVTAGDVWAHGHFCSTKSFLIPPKL